ncbi:MAG: amino acid racemase, partial [Gammaproteobacteria bacterium]|nr:amino acid racemase [Gammaproteobacteria bacterium]
MKKIGMLGGMSWESTAKYYEQVNIGIREKLGGLHSAKIAMVSLDFEEIDRLQRDGDWISATEVLTKAALELQNNGSDFLLICTNTMHKIYDEIQARLSIPVLHIADSTGQALETAGYKKVGLLGTKFTMEEDFYKKRLLENFNIEALVPSPARRDEGHRIIYEELCRGRLL